MVLILFIIGTFELDICFPFLKKNVKHKCQDLVRFSSIEHIQNIYHFNEKNKALIMVCLSDILEHLCITRFVVAQDHYTSDLENFFFSIGVIQNIAHYTEVI